MLRLRGGSGAALPLRAVVQQFLTAGIFKEEMISTTSVAILFILISSGGASQMLKREVDLLDMLRTPLMLSFNRDSVFVP
ncbi:hypothetical protein GCK32_001026, partial [Trichostrongylus colubriformis]